MFWLQLIMAIFEILKWFFSKSPTKEQAASFRARLNEAQAQAWKTKDLSAIKKLKTEVQTSYGFKD